MAERHRYSLARFVTQKSEMPFYSANTVPELVKHLEQTDGWNGLYVVHDRQPPTPGVDDEVVGTIMKDENDQVTWKAGKK